MASEAEYIFRLAARDTLQRAAVAASAEAQQAAQYFAKVFTRGTYRDRHIRIKTLFTAAAIEAQDSMVSAYKHRPYKTRSSIELSPYRNNARFSGGKLLNALKSPDMIKVTETGIRFINTFTLNTAAKQWKRLNFGAGGRGDQTPPAKHYHMKIFGQVLPGDIGLFEGPRPGFVLPSGYWSSTYPNISPVSWNRSRRGHDFFIFGAPGGVGPIPGQDSTRRGQRIGVVLKRYPTMSLGIKGSRFLDVGVGRLTQTFPVAIETLITEWFKEATTGTGPVFKANIDISPQALANINQALARQAVQNANSRRGRFITGR